MGRPNSIRESMPGLLRTLRFLWPYTRRHRGLIGGSLAALLGTVAMRALEPWPLKFVFDYLIVADRPSDAFLGVPLARFDTVTWLVLAAAALVLIVGGRAYGTYLNKVGFALVGNRVLTEVRAALYRHMQCLSLSFHNRARSGDLLVRVIGDIGMLKEVAVTAFMPLVGSVLVLVVMAGLMLWMNWQLALLVLVSLPLYMFPTVRLGRRIQRVSRKQRKREGAMASTAAESIGAIQVVKALSLEDTFSRTFSGANRKSMKEGVQARRLLSKLQGTVQLMTGVSTALVLGYGTLLVIDGALTAGSLLVFLSYLKSMFKPMQDFAKYSGRLAKASAAGERVVDLFERQPDVTDRPGAVDAPPLRGDVRFEHVDFAYEAGHPVLHDVDLRVRAGERVAVIGTSGNGKSTLVSLLPRFYDPTRGVVRIDGYDIRDFTLASLRAQISIVLQENLLFAASVYDNIAYGAPDVAPDAVRAAARLANAHGFIKTLPAGYDTVVGERGVTLSSGQRQRIAVARAAVRNAPILVLDEPTTGLDEENERVVEEALDRLSQGRTVFFITHDLSQAARADRVIVLEEGRILEAGTHPDLLRSGGRYATLYRMQSYTFSTEEAEDALATPGAR